MNHVLKLTVIIFFIGIAKPTICSDSDLEKIRNRAITELQQPVPDKTDIETLINTFRNNGSWPEINYEDASRVAFQHKVHVTNIRNLSTAFKNPASSFYQNDKLKQVISSAIDFWLAHDFIASNWHTNEISNPLDWTCVLLLMDTDLTKQQADGLTKLAGRANLESWGARPGGDRIKIAGIMAEMALYRRDTETLKMAVKTMIQAVQITSGLGIKPDLGFHHRTDRVTSILAYGTSYAETFARWAIRLEGTSYSFPQQPLQLITDYYLDGICKSMVYAWYPAPGILNRGMSRKSALDPVGSEMPEMLVKVSDYRKEELENIIKIRSAKTQPNLTYDKFFWHSEYAIHQRPDWYTSVRMYSDRNHNMEAPHNEESLKMHHFADGASFTSVTGKEYYDIYPVWDWQKIPGTTVVQKPALPHFDQIVKKGKTGFVGAVSDGVYGAAAFDFQSPHDPLKARKSWFLFDNEYVCLGTGIQSEAEFPVATTLNQCLLNGEVVVKTGNRESKLTKGEHQLNNVSWVHHDGIAYIFSKPTTVSLNNKTYPGSWGSIKNRSGAENEEVISKELFSLWIDHGKQPENASYEYIVAPGKSQKDIKKYIDDSEIVILANNSKIQAVQHKSLHLAQIVFYEHGTIKLPEGISVSVKSPGIIMIETSGNSVEQITVTDPSRKLKNFELNLTGKFVGSAANWKSGWNENDKTSEIFIQLPINAEAGKSVILKNNTFEEFQNQLNEKEVLNEQTIIEAKKSGKHYIGEKYGGGMIIWLDETGQHGLIASLSDQSNGIQWRNGMSKKSQHFGDHNDRIINSRSDGIFAGQMNTSLIISQLTEDNVTGNFAARVCVECGVGGYGDWYLPSKAELQLIYELRNEIGGFNNDMYWSSTEFNVGFVWGQNFQGYGGQYTQNKSTDYAVRCVRKF
jgi:chondroitin AC lyase